MIAEDGTSMKLKDAMTKSSGTFHTHTIQGKAAKVARKELMVPYKCYHTGVFKELRLPPPPFSQGHCHLPV